MFIYQGFKCVKTEDDTWFIRELCETKFDSFQECTKFIDNYYKNQERKTIVITSLVTLIFAIVLIAYTFFMR